MTRIDWKNLVSLRLVAPLFMATAGLAGILSQGPAALAQDGAKLGTRKAPLKLSMVPSSDSTKILTNLAPVAKCLEKETGYFFDISVPNNFIVVAEGLGANRVDVAFLNTFGYLLAHERYGAEALLKMSRQGATTYKGQILVRANSPVKSLEELSGKKIAYVDPASTSGYLLPKRLLGNKNVKPAEEVFAGKHDAVVTMVYQGQVDAGATYFTPAEPDGSIGDARKLVKAQFPDVAEKVKILTYTEEIPNDPLVVRKELTSEMKEKLKLGFQACVKTHVESFKGVNSADGLAPVKDSDYDPVRKIVQELKIDLAGSLKKK